MHAATIIGYTYRAENYTPSGVLEALYSDQFDGWRPVGGPVFNTVERELDELANVSGIDRMDEYTFDSDDFPKVIFASQVEGKEYGIDADGESVPLI